MIGMRFFYTRHKPLWIFLLFVFGVSNGWAQEALTFKQLPNKIKSHIEHDLTTFFKEDLEKVRFVALAGGRSGTPIYKATLKDETGLKKLEYVIRVYSSNEVKAQTNNIITRFVGTHGFGPKVLFPKEDVPSSILITDFAKGEPPNPDQFQSYQKIFAKSIRDFHALNALGLPEGVDLISRIKLRMNQVGKMGPFLEDLNLINQMDTALTTHPYKFGLVHQDLNVGNLFFDGQSFSYIDWANSGFGDVMGDVANVTVEFGLDDEQAKAFLEEYLEKKPSKKELAQFNLWRQAGILRITAWAYEKMHRLDGEYKPMLVNMTFPKTANSIIKGEMKLDTANDFLVLLGVTHQYWQEHKEAIQGWIKDLNATE